MNIEVTNQNLYEIQIELNQMAPRVIGMLLRSRIADFYKHNGIKINTLMENITKIQKQFCEFKDGAIRMEEIEGTKKVVFLEGKTSEMLNVAYKELMDKKTTITI